MGKSEWELLDHRKEPNLRVILRDQFGNLLSATADGITQDEFSYIALAEKPDSKIPKPVLSEDEVRAARRAITKLNFSHG